MAIQSWYGAPCYLQEFSLLPPLCFPIFDGDFDSRGHLMVQDGALASASASQAAERQELLFEESLSFPTHTTLLPLN
jgi:hypothetical protein